MTQEQTLEQESPQTEAQKHSPMMMQWHACKQLAKDAILLFRLGDFYEAFHEDAAILSKELDLTLTRRQEIPMSGVPAHTCESYIDKLVSKGYRVAVAEQTEDAKITKGLVRREIARVVTPGTLINSSLLAERSNNFFAALTKVGNIYGLAVLDLTTSEFKTCEFSELKDLINEIHRLRPAEVLTTPKLRESQQGLFDEIQHSFPCLITTDEGWHFDHQTAHDFLVCHLNVHSLEGFGLTGMVAAINAAGALLHYVQENLNLPTHHIREILPYSTANYLSLDRTSQRNLELTESLHDGGRKNTLLEVLDHTSTPMGARLMRHWIKQPLLSIAEINRRQDAIAAFIHHPTAIEQLKSCLTHVRDLERLMMKASSGYASPRDLVALARSFDPMAEIKALLAIPNAPLISEEASKLETLPEMTQLIARAIVDEPPMRPGEGKVFKEGFHAELDELRELSRDGKAWLARYQTQLREQTGIKTIKVGFNKMFGYYIEVSRGQADKMPDIFIRRQTLVNAERYVTPELKEYESKVLTAEERVNAIENELFLAVRAEVAKYSQQVLRVAQALARIDCLLSLAETAVRNHYCRPEVDESFVLEIEDGRHAVIEACCLGEKFISNDTLLDDNTNRLLLITGPNMSGKSTYMRQVALITIMAQMGSFVPAKRARIGLVDRVFTRIGASDDLSRGQSTFMVEMTETANILHNATSRSLVILDEIGRGTSTYDGISIAWAVAEYLLTTEGKIAKTLFATHYWELTRLEDKVPGAVNYHVAVNEAHDQITFLRKIVRGGTDKSYGIHVGRLAGLPQPVIGRAKEILGHLEENANRKNIFEPPARPKRAAATKIKDPTSNRQMTFFQ